MGSNPVAPTKKALTDFVSQTKDKLTCLNIFRRRLLYLGIVLRNHRQVGREFSGQLFIYPAFTFAADFEEKADMELPTNIAIITDDNCIEGACIVIRSFLKNNKTKCRIYTMLDLLSEESKVKLETAADVKYSGNEITNLSVPQSVHDAIGRFGTINNFPPLVFYRLFLPWMVGDIDRILYLDSDLLIRKSIMPFYNSDFTGNLCACVPDIQGKIFGQEIGLDNYVNSGVILFNIQKIKEQYTLDTYLDHFSTQAYSVQLQYPDQDVLNLMYQKQILYCSERYNNHMAYWKKNVLRYPRRLYSSCIVHFTGRPKPWDIDYMFPFALEYFGYLKHYRSPKENLQYWVQKPVSIIKYTIQFFKVRKQLSHK